MSIEKIKKRLEGLKGYDSGLADQDYPLYLDIQHAVDDVEFLLEQNHRLVEALKGLPLALEGLVHEDGDTMIWNDVERFTYDYINKSLQAYKLLEKKD